VLGLLVIAGCEDPSEVPFARRISHTSSDLIIAVQENGQIPVSTGLVRVRDHWCRVSLPAHRFVPYCSAARFENTLLIGRMDGMVYCIDDVVLDPKVRETPMRLDGPVVLTQFSGEDWLVVGRHEILLGHLPATSGKLEEKLRLRIDSLCKLNGKAELTHAAYNESLKSLMLCFSNGAVATIELACNAQPGSEFSSKVRMLGDIAAIGTVGDTTYILTVDGSCLSYGLVESGVREFKTLWDKTIRCGHMSFLLPNRSWVVETNSGQTKEIYVIDSGKQRLLMNGKDLRLLGDGGDDSGSFMVSSVKEKCLKQYTREDCRLLRFFDLTELIR